MNYRKPSRAGCARGDVVAGAAPAYKSLRNARVINHRRLAKAGGYRPRLESLEDRCLLATDVILEWNAVAIKAAMVNPVNSLRTE